MYYAVWGSAEMNRDAKKKKREGHRGLRHHLKLWTMGLLCMGIIFTNSVFVLPAAATDGYTSEQEEQMSSGDGNTSGDQSDDYGASDDNSSPFIEPEDAQDSEGDRADAGNVPEEDASDSSGEDMPDTESGAEEESKDLTQYINMLNAVSGETASITLSVLNSDNSDASTDEDGNITVTDSTEYRLGLTIYSSAGFDAGTYVYEMPDGITLKDANGNITIGDIIIGSWRVTTNAENHSAFSITIDPSESDTYTDVTIQFSALAAFTRQETDITIGGKTIVVSENSSVALAKSSSFEEDRFDEQSGYYTAAKWEIELSQNGVPLAGTRIEDMSSDTQHNRLFDAYYDQSEYARYSRHHFDTSRPLSFTLTQQDGTVYQWTVDWNDENLTLYTASTASRAQVTETSDKDQRIVGYTYIFPDEVEAYAKDGSKVNLNLKDSDSLGNYELNLTAYSDLDMLPSTSTLSVLYYNTALVTNTKDQQKLAQVYTKQIYTVEGGYRVNKTWERGEDAVSVNWTVDAYIAGGVMTSYQLRDYMRIRKTVNGTTSMDPISSDMYDKNTGFTITIADNTTLGEETLESGSYTMYDINSAEGVPDSAKFVYYYYYLGGSNHIGFYVFGMECNCSEEEGRCKSWSDGQCSNVIYTNPETGKKYCACWQLNQTAKVQLTYTTSKEDMLDLLSTYGYTEGITLYNNAELNSGNYLGRKIYLGESAKLDWDAASVGMALAQKTLTDPASAENDYTAAYQIVVNKAHVQLTENGAPVTITDTMSDTMSFAGNLTIQSTDTAGSTSTLIYGSDYTYEYVSDTHTLKIQILNPGTNAYTLNYKTQMINPTSQATYSNSFVLSWQGKDITVATAESNITDVSSSGVTYRITLQKVDEVSKTLLPGAQFGLYNAADDAEKAKGTTDASGLLTFRTVAGTGQGALTLTSHTLYYLQEISPPSGYIPDSEKYYFYFCDENETCEACNTLLSQLPSGMDDQAVHRHKNGAFVTITNKQQTYGFTIRKVDANANKDGTYTALTGAEFYLYYESAVLDGDGNPTDTVRKYYAVLDEDGALIGWNSSIDQASCLAVDSDGLVSIQGLPAGTYNLEESTAPTGYCTLAEAIKLTISEDGELTETSDAAEVSGDEDSLILQVKNARVYELPMTGAAGGISGYRRTGIILMLVNLLLLSGYSHVRRRKTGASK